MAADVPPGFEGYAGETVPGATPGTVGKNGRLELRFARADGRTRLVRDYARAPYHVSGTLDHDPLPEATTVFVQSPSSGVAQGDRRSVAVSVGPEAVAGVSTGSSTKVLSMEHNYARTETTLTVAAGGHLDYVPEPTILHADARLARSTTLSVAPTASAVLGSIVVPGRLARGERFAFERFRSRTTVESTGDLLATDAVDLRPGERDPRVPGVVGDGAVFGSLLVVAPAEDGLSDPLHNAVTDNETPGTAGATRLPNNAGVLVRAVGPDTASVRGRLRRGWTAARERLVGAPPPERRK